MRNLENKKPTLKFNEVGAKLSIILDTALALFLSALFDPKE